MPRLNWLSWWFAIGICGWISHACEAADTGPTVLIYTTASQSAAHRDSSAFERLTDQIRIEISRARRQLTVYRGSDRLKSYPVAVGRVGWETPVGNFRIFQMVEDPDWQHPLSGKVFQTGDSGNQLGHYWIGFWTDGKAAVGLHGTPHPETVGKAASHGCVRMYEKDIEELFSKVEVGTPVIVTR